MLDGDVPNPTPRKRGRPRFQCLCAAVHGDLSSATFASRLLADFTQSVPPNCWIGAQGTDTPGSPVNSWGWDD